jgi:hypothetical protein
MSYEALDGKTTHGRRTNNTMTKRKRTEGQAILSIKTTQKA